MYRVEKDTTADSIKDYIVNNDVEVRSIDCVSNENATFSSFKVEIRVSDMSQVLDPEFWPSGVHVRRFYAARQSSTNTDSNS